VTDSQTRRLASRWAVLAIVAIVTVATAGSAQAITIATVPVGRPGNSNDLATGLGGVSYLYNIGKYDVTVGQYAAFLSAVATTDTYSLYNTSMATDLNIAGIARNGASGGFTYSVIGSPNHPITDVSWGSAARFSNWMNNGQPAGPEGPGTTETGAYTLNGATSDALLNAVTRNAGAKWFIPSESEWFKAAYYDPTAGHYWQYPTGTDTPPTSTPPGSTPNTANFRSVNGVFAVTGSPTYSSTQNYLTDIGAYTASASPYGTFDQGGDANQWNEALIDGAFRGMRGGSWSDFALGRQSRDFGFYPSTGADFIGFRVASIREPGTAVLAAIAFGLAFALRRHFR
jgi:formylglycine-generating enzyme